MAKKLVYFFNPRSIAIVGVSTNPKKVGQLVARNILDQGFRGKLYFLHPTATEILGKKVYADFAELPETPDLAILALPSESSVSYLDKISSRGCKNVLVYAAGFKEIGGRGTALELTLIEKAKEYGLTILGPNCLGFINSQAGINATFLKGRSPAGNIGFISQSGALGSALVDYFAGHVNLGFSYFISLGNKAQIDETDCLELLKDDPHTKVIAMYLEDVKDGWRFRQTLQETSRLKPVVIIKSGATREGSKAALSHTGGLVGDDLVYTAVFRQCGAIRAKNFSELTTLLRILSFDRLPASRNVLVLSNAGGVGVLLADDLVKNYLSLQTISEQTKQELYKAFGEVRKISIHNPIDLLGDASAFDYKKAIDSTINEKDIGAVIVLLTPQANTEILQTAEVIASVQKDCQKPIYPVFMGDKSVALTRSFFETHHIPYFRSYDPLPPVLDQINLRQEWLKNTSVFQSVPQFISSLANLQAIEAKTIIDNSSGKRFLSFGDSFEVIRLAGIPTTPLVFVKNEEELVRQSAKLNYPLVMKLYSEHITHKTEVGGVVVDIRQTSELIDAYRRICRSANNCQGVYLQPMVNGQELLLGAKRDRIFGVVVVLGLGGIYAELLKEMSQLVYPFTFAEFELVIERTKLSSLFEGFRGADPIDKEGLYEICLKLAQLLIKITEIKEVDINPLIVSGYRFAAVDCRVIL